MIAFLLFHTFILFYQTVWRVDQLRFLEDRNLFRLFLLFSSNFKQRRCIPQKRCFLLVRWKLVFFCLYNEVLIRILNTLLKWTLTWRGDGSFIKSFKTFHYKLFYLALFLYLTNLFLSLTKNSAGLKKLRFIYLSLFICIYMSKIV